MNVDAAEPIFSLIGLVIASGGGGAAVAYGIFKFLGRSWIENKFTKNLEEAKTEFSIHAARRMKLHDKEYEVFPEVWRLLNRACSSLGTLIVSPEPPRFPQMTNSQIEDFVKRSDFSESEKALFVSAPGKTVAYGAIQNFRNSQDALIKFGEFNTYFQSNRIFFRPDIKEKFDQISEQIHLSWTARAKALEIQDPDTEAYRQIASEVYDQIKPLMEEIEELVQARLFPESQAGKAGEAKP